MADEVNITVGDNEEVDTEVEGEGGDGENGEVGATETDVDAIWLQSLKMQETGVELLKSTMAAVNESNSRLSEENRQLRETVAAIPERMETAVTRMEQSILSALKPQPATTHLSDASQTETLESVVVVEPAAEAATAEQPPVRQKRHRTL